MLPGLKHLAYHSDLVSRANIRLLSRILAGQQSSQAKGAHGQAAVTHEVAPVQQLEAVRREVF